MTQKIETILDNIQAQSTLGKLLLPVICIFATTMSIIYFSGGGNMVHLALVIAAMLAFYLAINIGANDVANNVGLFPGNTDRNTRVENFVPPGIVAKSVKLTVMSWREHISMRFDVTGCLVPRE